MRKHPYFSHDIDAHNDEKILSLRAEAGLEGYGFYWILIEIMASQEDYCLDRTIFLEKNLSTRTGISIKKVSKFLEILKSFQLISENSEKLFSNSLLKRMNLKDNIAKKNSENIAKRWNNEDSVDTTVLPPENVSYALGKVKERKGNIKEKKVNTKEKINKKEILPDPPFFVDSELWDKFVIQRTEMKKPLTIHACELLFDDLQVWHQKGIDVNRCIKNSVIGRWQGIFKKSNGQGSKENTISDTEEKCFVKENGVVEWKIRDKGGYEQIGVRDGKPVYAKVKTVPWESGITQEEYERRKQ